MNTGRIRDGYGTIQRDIMTSELSQHAKLVYCLLVSYAGQKNACYPSITTMCRDLKAGRTTIIKGINELIENKLVHKETRTRDDGGNSSNIYYPMMLMEDSPSLDRGRGAVLTEDWGSSGGGLPPVLREDSKNNIKKNNKEDCLNPNGLRDAKKTEQDFELDLQEQNTFVSPQKSSAKKDPPKKTTHQLLMDLYWEWYKGLHDGIEPSITKADGMAMSHLRKFLEKQATNKLQERLRAEPSPEDVQSETVKMLHYIFNNWHLLRPFEQSGLSIRQINSNITNIINQIKNGRQKTTQKAGSTAASIKQAFDNIDRAFGGN